MAAPAFPRLHQSYAAALPDLSVRHRADPVPEARIAVLDAEVATGLGYDPGELRTPEGTALLTGRLDEHGHPAPGPAAPAGEPFTTAQAYAGHQFGSPNPLLGDGRALLLGDLVDPRGRWRDLHLKGSGPTPFSRAGDGRAPLGPMLREHMIGESLHALGIPTTRALAVLTTGASVLRRRPEPGAILVRSAASHLRVGTVQYAAWHLGPDQVRDLVAYTIERHWPQARADGSAISGGREPSPALALLRCLSRAQAELVAAWMLVGFVHGVMNTDNMSLAGESIDFGPCAFLDVHRADAVFSSIDTQGRYAYRNQPGIALWNLSRLAEALLPAIDEEDPQAAVDAATAVLEGFEPAFREAWTRGMAAKLGIPLGPPGTDPERLERVRTLGEDALAMLERHGADHTGFFRALTEGRAGELFAGDAPRADLAAWERRRDALAGTGKRADAARRAMASVNPVHIPRNHHLERALLAAERGDLTPYERLLGAVRDPFRHHGGLEDLEGPGTGADAPFVTFCGT